MDDKHFDDFTRALATTRTRRGFLGTLAASVATAFTGARGSAAPKADKPSKCYGGGSKCTNGKQCCSGTCTNRQCVAETTGPECLTATTCPGDDTPCEIRTCAGGECGSAFVDAGTFCPTGVCNGNGSCVECVTGAQCASGVCGTNVCEPPPSCTADQNFGAPCSVGLGACMGTGVLVCAPDGVSLMCNAVEGMPSVETCNGIDDDCDGEVDEGAACPSVDNAFGTCAAGACAYTCNEGFADCNADLADGCETGIFFDGQNCGGCGVVCPIAGTFVGNALDFVCIEGNCVCFSSSDCPTGQECTNASFTNPGICL